MIEYDKEYSCIIIYESGLSGGKLKGGMVNIRAISAKDYFIKEYI